MKVVRTEIDEAEYNLLKRLADKEGKSIKELVREAIKKLLGEERINPNDPIFTEPPLIVEEGLVEETSERHDKVILW